MKNQPGQTLSGGKILLESLLEQGVDTVFGYPGGSIMPTYDDLLDYSDCMRHVLVRHEQGAIHAAQGYARSSGRTGCVIVTSGPGATNVVTGVADAMIDSTPVVVIAGQVPVWQLGTDAFQESDVIGLMTPISKWAYQIRRPEDVAWAVARAFYIASSGRPGPVVLDFTKDAQVGTCIYEKAKCDFIRSYVPVPEIPEDRIQQAVEMIDAARKPFVVYGQGVTLSGAQDALAAFLEKGDIPAGSTMMGLSALPTDNPRHVGMVGMHGNIACNVLTQECDLLIAVGMRFSDRVTGEVSHYARNAKILHIDIDASEIGKNVPVDLGIAGDARDALTRITAAMKPGVKREDWRDCVANCYKSEERKVISSELHSSSEGINPGEVVDLVARMGGAQALVVTDVGENQLVAARYSRFAQPRSLITSGGLGTMGFGLPAAIGAKIACPGRQVVLFAGDGGFQMTLQELGTIMQEKTGVKMVILNNNWLGNVRMLQELFCEERYSYTHLVNPDFKTLASAYGIECVDVDCREALEPAVCRMLSDDKPFILNVRICEDNMVFPIVPPGKSVDEMMLNKNEWYGN